MGPAIGRLVIPTCLLPLAALGTLAKPDTNKQVLLVREAASIFLTATGLAAM